MIQRDDGNEKRGTGKIPLINQTACFVNDLHLTMNKAEKRESQGSPIDHRWSSQHLVHFGVQTMLEPARAELSVLPQGDCEWAPK